MITIHITWPVIALLAVVGILVYRNKSQNCVENKYAYIDENIGLMPKEVDEMIEVAVREERIRVIEHYRGYLKEMEGGLFVPDAPEAEKKENGHQSLPVRFLQCNDARSKEECENPDNSTCLPPPAAGQCIAAYLFRSRNIILDFCASTDTSLVIDVNKWNQSQTAEECKTLFPCAADLSRYHDHDLDQSKKSTDSVAAAADKMDVTDGSGGADGSLIDEQQVGGGGVCHNDDDGGSCKPIV